MSRPTTAPAARSNNDNEASSHALRNSVAPLSSDVVPSAPPSSPPPPPEPEKSLTLSQADDDDGDGISVAAESHRDGKSASLS